MEIILQKDIDNLGFQYDVVKVKPGYARNFLIPKGMARLATPSARKSLEEVLKQKAQKEEKEIVDAQKKALALEQLQLKIEAKAGNDGKLFGSVTSIQVAEHLKAQGFEIDKKYITLPGSALKKTGKHYAKVRLHRRHIVDFPFEIVRELESKKGA